MYRTCVPQGVFLTFAAEGGAKKLRRIRFSRSLFTADSAKQVWGVGVGCGRCLCVC